MTVQSMLIDDRPEVPTPAMAQARIDAEIVDGRKRIAELEDVTRNLEEECGDLRGKIVGLKDELADADGEIETLSDRVDAIDDHITELVRVRTLVRAGRTPDALYELERVLAHLDNCWTLRIGRAA